MLLDLCVQLGLGEHGLIELVVAVAAVADHVDDDVGAPLVPVLEGGLDGGRDGEGVVAVAVEDGGPEGLAEVGAVRGGTGVVGVGGEADLVVHNDVDGPAHGEVGDARELHGLVDDSLAGEGRVPVQEDRNYLLLVDVPVPAVVLLGAGLACDDGVDALQVGRVGDQAEMDLAAVGVGPVHAGSEVVLDVAADSPLARNLLGVDILVVVGALELGEDEGHRLAHDVGQDVEPAPVGHPDDEAVRAKLGGAVDAPLEGRNDGLPPIQPEALGGVELVGEEGLEGIGEAQALEDVHLLLLVVVQPAGMLDALPDPVALVGVPDVHVLDAQRPAVGLVEGIDDGAEGDLPRHAGELL